MRPATLAIIGTALGAVAGHAFRAPFPGMGGNPVLDLIAYHDPGLHTVIRVWYYATPAVAVVLAGSLCLSVWRVWLQPPARGRSRGRLPAWPTSPNDAAPSLVIGELHHPTVPRESERPSWLVIPEKGLYTGVLVVGAVGTGKTTACMYPFAQQLLSWQADRARRRASALVLEVKGDFCHSVRRILDDAGRGGDYLEIGLDGSLQWNPLDDPLLDSCLPQCSDDLLRSGSLPSHPDLLAEKLQTRSILTLHLVSFQRVRSRRLMRLMGMEATYRRPRTSVASPEHRVFPYLLRGLTISRADHVWCADITYVPVTQGFFYLVAVMDWATRHVLAWRLSNTMDASFCVQALDDALGWRAPEILNTDQGSQFTSEAFADRVLGAGVRFSMDGRGRFLDNIFIERLWRSLKYEAVYLYELRDGPDAQRIIGSWIDFYNEARPHSSLGGRTPGEAYREGAEVW